MNLSGDNLVFIGEYDKWVFVSPQRVFNIQLTQTSFTAYVQGALNESVTFAFNLNNQSVKVICKFIGSNTLKLHYENGKFMCA